MITIKQEVFVAVLRDLGYSGERKPNIELGYFKREALAARIAKENSREGNEPYVEERLIDIQVFENEEEYRRSFHDSLVQSAISKLTPQEYEALASKFRD